MANESLEKALVRLAPVKGVLARASDGASRGVRSCAGCPAPCCRVGLNSMKITRIEAEALARRLAEPDLAGLRAGILAKAKAEIRARGLTRDPDATYDCPLLSPEGRCLVHGPAQPAACLTFRPVSENACDQDLPLLHREEAGIAEAERAAFGRLSAIVSIPEALVRILGRRRER